MNATSNNLQEFNKKFGKVFCVKPFTEICNTPTGSIKLCCNSDVVIHHSERKNESLTETFYNHPKLQEIRKQLLEGKSIQACNRCYRDEELTGKSIRTFSTKSLETHEPEMLAKIISEGDKKIRSMDIKFGNKCNLGCVMCDAKASSVIAKERFVNNIPVLLDDEIKQTKEDEIEFEFHDVEFEKLKNHAGEIRSFSAKGGEPTLLPFYNKWTEYLVENKFSQNISFFTVTNGTVDLSTRVDRYSKFKDFEICWSVDAVNKSFDYIRWPAKFEKIQKNHKKFIKIVEENEYNNFYFMFNTVAHCLNIDQMVPIAEYADSLKVIDDIAYLDAHSPDGLFNGLISEKTLETFRNQVNIYCNSSGKFKQELNDIFNIVENNWQEIRQDKNEFQKKLNKLKTMVDFWKNVRGLDVNDYCPTYQDTISQLK